MNKRRNEPLKRREVVKRVIFIFFLVFALVLLTFAATQAEPYNRVVIKVEKFNDQNVRSYWCCVDFSKGLKSRSESYYRENPNNPPIINDLLRIEGIREVQLAKYEIMIEKAMIFEWEDIHEKIINVFKKYLNCGKCENLEISWKNR